MKYWSLALVAINVIVFGLQFLVPGITQSYALYSDALFTNPISLITSMFLHGSVLHLLGNMFALGLFGLILENFIGSRKFLGIYFASGIISGIAASIVYSSAIGASGAIFGVMGALAALRPKLMVWTYGVPMPMFVAAAFWLVLDIAGAFYPSNVANVAHIAGLIFGIGIGLTLRKEEPKTRRSRLLSDDEFNLWEDFWMKRPRR